MRKKAAKAQTPENCNLIPLRFVRFIYFFFFSFFCVFAFVLFLQTHTVTVAAFVSEFASHCRPFLWCVLAGYLTGWTMVVLLNVNALQPMGHRNTLNESKACCIEQQQQQQRRRYRRQRRRRQRQRRQFDTKQHTRINIRSAKEYIIMAIPLRCITYGMSSFLVYWR